jgi:hypothetical protein
MSRLSKWVSTTGTVAIKDMEVSHLVNVSRVVRNYAKDRDNGRNSRGMDSPINGRPIHEWLADFHREITRRNKVRLTGRTR